MDVTAEIIRNTIVYGASDYTAAHSLSSSRSLNYVTGGSITKPDVATVSIIPFTLNYQDAVGLFGAENYFIKININVDLTATNKCFEEPLWECARLSKEDGTVNTYASGIIDQEKDLTTVNTYDPATITTSLQKRRGAYLSIDLSNLKTGNKYIDSWFDVRLYTSGREEHPYNRMYIRANDFFYIGFHARNTRRLPYNVECIVGNEYLSEENLTDDQRRYIARKIS